MGLLVSYIGLGLRPLAFAKAQGTVATLPGELVREFSCVVEVMRARSLESLYDIGNGKFGWDGDQEMDVVVPTVDGIDIYAQFSRFAHKIGM
jgi:hypothetical protein